MRVLVLCAFAILAPLNLLAAPSAESFRDAERGTQFYANAAAAELATETVLASVFQGFLPDSSSLPFFAQQVPSVSNVYYQNYLFSNPKTGASNSAYMVSTGNNFAQPLDGLWSGMYGSTADYGIYSTAQSVNDPSGISAAQAQLNVRFATVPIFEFAIFYNGLMEFSDTATLFVAGRVHGNSNIYVGSPENLTFNSFVSCAGTISKPANAGYNPANWTGSVIYNGTPNPGFATNAPALYLPLGMYSSSILEQQILYPPPNQESYNSPLGQQRYWNKAQMTLVVSNTFFTATFKSAPNDPLPYVLSTNLTYITSTNSGSTWNWLSTTNTFYDWRENKNVSLTQIDVGKMTNWMAHWLMTNAFTSNKFGFFNPFDIVYVADFRANGSALSAVRLVNGANLPSSGLTVATPNPLYIQGVYNCPNAAFQGTTNTTLSAPASVVCDALTFLSPSWQDYGSIFAQSSSTHGHAVTNFFSSQLAQSAVSDTVNTAIVAGNVVSTGTDSTNFSGGVNNLPRLLEDWSEAVLTYNGSLACLFGSSLATNQFRLPGEYYYAPTVRNFSYDLNFTIASRLPPGTPELLLPVERTYQAILSPNIVPP